MGLQNLNDDVILELSRYLTNRSRHSLAYTCRNFFRVSQNWSFWHPHHWPKFDSILPAFFSKFLLWSEYEGSDYRVAFSRQAAFHLNWQSSSLQVKKMVQLKPGSEDLISGTTWMPIVRGDNHGTRITIIDTLNGNEATVEYPGLVLYTAIQFSSFPRASPGELLLAAPEADPDYIPSQSRLYHLRVMTTPGEDGEEKLEITKMRAEPTKLQFPLCHRIGSRYICSSSSFLPGMSDLLHLYDTDTSACWEWEVTGNRTVVLMVLLDEWFMVVTKDQKISLIAIHLPSLRAVCPPTTTQQSRRVLLPTGICLPDTNDLTGTNSQLHITAAPPSRFQGRPDTYLEREQDTFTLIATNHSYFRIYRFHLSYPEYDGEGDQEGLSGATGRFQSCRPDEVCLFLGCRAANHANTRREDLHGGISYTHLELQPLSANGWNRNMSAARDMILDWLHRSRYIILRTRIVGVDGSDDYRDLAVDLTGQKTMLNSPRGPRIAWGARAKIEVRFMSGESGYIMVLPVAKSRRGPVMCWF